MKYFYQLLDYTLISSIEIPFLNMSISQNTDFAKIIELNIYFKTYDDENMEETFVIDFKCNLTYVVYKGYNLIEVYTDSNEKVISSFFNIPLSVFLERDNSFILHASSIEIDGSIFAFSGQKGVGKSTLTFLLSQYYNFYSDDTLVIKAEQQELQSKNLTPIIRLCKDTYINVTQFGNFDDLLHNIVGKAYVLLDDVNLNKSSTEIGKLKSIFFIERTFEPVFKLHVIESSIVKYINVVNNIVGINQKSSEWLFEERTKELLNLIVEQVSMYKLSVPNDFEYLRKTFIHFIQDILEK